MLRLVDKESPNARRLVLGFDGGCFTCLKLAKRIEERLGDKLEVQNLHEPRIEQWRKSALGENAPWTPTLFEIRSGKVRAWTGWRLGLALTRFLGPADTWKVMQVLGEMGASSKVEESKIVEKLPSKAAEAIVGISRGQFLKGVGGTALALSMLSATGKLASPAEAASKPKSVRVLKGTELFSIAREKAQSKDFRNVADEKWSKRMQEGKVIGKSCYNDDCATVISFGKGCTIFQDNSELRLDGDCMAIMAAKHKLENNNSVLVVSYVLPNNQLVLYHEFEKEVRPKGGKGGIKSRAKLWEIKGKKGHLKEVSVNGREAALHERRASRGAISVQGPDDACGEGLCYEPYCSDVNWFCIYAYCFGCAGTCALAETGIGGLICAACLGTICIPAIGIDEVDYTGYCCNGDGYYCTEGYFC